MIERLLIGLWTAAAAWLLVVCTLIACSLAPLLLGWKPSVIVTASMMPSIKPGDVVVVDPDRKPALGQIVLVNDPEAATGRIAHRVTAIDPDGTMTTKGDANQSVDSVRHGLTDVVGVARLVVPGAGRLAVLRTHPSHGDRLWALMTAVAASVFALTHGLTRRSGGRRVA